MRALLRPGAIEAVRREWRAQIARVVAAGLTVSHLDSHKHVHMLPPLLDIAGELALAFQVAVRTPVAPVADRRERPPSAGSGWRCCGRSRRARSSASSRSACTSQITSSASPTAARMSTERLRAALATARPDGTTEVMMHPAALTDGVAGLRDRYAWARAYRFTDELAALCDGEVRDDLRRSERPSTAGIVARAWPLLAVVLLGSRSCRSSARRSTGTASVATCRRCSSSSTQACTRRPMSRRASCARRSTRACSPRWSRCSARARPCCR